MVRCHCGGLGVIEWVSPPIPLRQFDVAITCGQCYDGAPDAPNRHDIAYGRNTADAILAWVEMQADLADEVSE